MRKLHTFKPYDDWSTDYPAGWCVLLNCTKPIGSKVSSLFCQYHRIEAYLIIFVYFPILFGLVFWVLK